MRYLLLFLILLIPVQTLAINLSHYWSYSWEMKTLSLFWMYSPVSSLGFEIALSKVNNGSGCANYTYELLSTSRTIANNISFSGLMPGRYDASIKTINSDGVAVDSGIHAVTVIMPATKDFQLGWCNSDDPVITSVNVYSDPEPSFNFGKSKRTVTDFRSMTDVYKTQNFDIQNLVYTNVAADVESAPSEQIIIYSIIPETPVWEGIK